MKKEGMSYFVSLGFERVSLPPFQDILILARKCPQGINGVSKCMQLLAPDGFELLELEDDVAEALLVSKQVLARMKAEKVIEILREKVFPYMTKGEIIKVDFHIKVSYEAFQITSE